MKMEKGKIPYNSLIRSVLRVPFERKEAEQVARDGALVSAGGTSASAGVTDGPATDAGAAVSVGAAPVGASVNTTVYGGVLAEKLAFYRSFNSALAAGILPESVMLSLTLPVGEKETTTAERMRAFKAIADEEGVKIAGGHTTYSAQVSAPVLTVVVSGIYAEEGGCACGVRAADAKNGIVKPGMDLIMTGFAGDAGAMLLYHERGEVLKQRFTGDYLDVTVDAEEHLSASKCAKILRKTGAVMHDVSEGGVLGALWEFAEGHHIGFTVDEKKIPIHQETIETCEYLGGNPYALISTGCMLATVQDGEAAVKALTEAGIPAVCIGKTESGKQKKLLRHDETRFLDRPQQDFIMELETFG